MYKWLRRFVDPYCPPDKVGTGHLPLVKGEKESGVCPKDLRLRSLRPAEKKSTVYGAVVYFLLSSCSAYKIVLK